MKLEQHFNINFCIRQSAFFPPQKDYTEEISQLLVHTLEEMSAKGRGWKKNQKRQAIGTKRTNINETRTLRVDLGGRLSRW